MIPIQRGPEPAALVDVRTRKLTKLRESAAAPRSDELQGYTCVAEDLWQAQHKKCCYCEMWVRKRGNDVEHYRPKARADRMPGSQETHGYWWLAFTWNNLLFACSTCNQVDKRIKFPLAPGSVALQLHQSAPGQEQALLLDPGGAINPVEHLEFHFQHPSWHVRPRNGSRLGRYTIDVLHLDAQDLVELQDQHVCQTVEPRVDELKRALNARLESAIRQSYNLALALLEPRRIHVGLTYDVLRTSIPDQRLMAWGLRWPDPAEVGLPDTVTKYKG